MLLISRAFCADVTPAALSQAGEVLETEHIFICLIFAPDNRGTNTTITALRRLGARKQGATWSYTNTRQKKAFEIHLVVNSSDMAKALYTEKAHIIIRGHSNFGLGGVYATGKEFAAQAISSIRYMDDDRLVNYSSPWVAVNVPRLLAHQSFPNWWPVFKDGTSAIMPYDFHDPRGDPPYNYYLTYQVPGDPTWYRIETVNNSALERFPGCDKPAWHAADGTTPDPENPDHAQYFLTNTNGAFETVGRWLGSSAGGGYLGTGYLYAPAGTGLNQVAWFFTIPTPGTYTISARWPASARNVASAQYSVTHAQGTTTASVNQKINGGNWNKLGAFVFDAGEYAVVLTDKPGSGTGTVVADAVRITGVTNGGIFDQTIDNSACPKAHFGKKTIVFRKDLPIDPEKLRYTRMYYDGCYSGQYFLGTFHRGLTFYTVNDSDMHGFETYLKLYFGGASDEDIWAAIQHLQPVYDYYDFTKSPADQATVQAQSRLVPAVPSANQEALTRPLAEISAVRALDTLKGDEFIHDAALSRQAVLRAFGHRKAEGIALALKQMTLPVLKSGEARAQSRVDDFVAAQSILEAFPDESVPALRALYGRSNALTRGNIVRGSGGIPGGDAVRGLLVGALEDKSICEEASPESVGEPLRVCDVAYNQLVLRCRVKDVLRTIGPGHRVEIRDYHIGILKTKL